MQKQPTIWKFVIDYFKSRILLLRNRSKVTVGW